MPDLLTHALVAFTICTLLRLRYGWLDAQYVTVGMAGAFVPDVAKIALLVDGSLVAVLIGRPFSWFGIHTLGGALLLLLVGVVLARRDERRPVGALLAVGAASHLLADALLFKLSGHSFPILWPITPYQPPTPGLYHSTDLWPSILLAGVAVCTWIGVRWRDTPS